MIRRLVAFLRRERKLYLLPVALPLAVFGAWRDAIRARRR